MSIQIFKGIQLPTFDIEMLNLGKLVAVPFKQSILENEVFWLYPSQQIFLSLAPDQYYQADYLALAEYSLKKNANLPIQIETWGRCEYPHRSGNGA
jgi:hypothetical protein